MITDKNKEEIEKISCGTELSQYCYCGRIEELTGAMHLCPTCYKTKQATIKTSILWCEDEIEFLNSIFPGGKYEVEDKLFLKCINRVESKIYQLQTHLTWLKEQEKEL